MLLRWLRRIVVVMPLVAFASLLIGLATLVVLGFLWFMYQ